MKTSNTLLTPQTDSRFYVTDGNETHYYSKFADAKSDFQLLIYSLKRHGGEWHAIFCNIEGDQILEAKSAA